MGLFNKRIRVIGGKIYVRNGVQVQEVTEEIGNRRAVVPTSKISCTNTTIYVYESDLIKYSI